MKLTSNISTSIESRQKYLGQKITVNIEEQYKRNTEKSLLLYWNLGLVSYFSTSSIVNISCFGDFLFLSFISNQKSLQNVQDDAWMPCCLPSCSTYQLQIHTSVERTKIGEIFPKHFKNRKQKEVAKECTKYCEIKQDERKTWNHPKIKVKIQWIINHLDCLVCFLHRMINRF